MSAFKNVEMFLNTTRQMIFSFLWNLSCLKRSFSYLCITCSWCFFSSLNSFTFVLVFSFSLCLCVSLCLCASVSVCLAHSLSPPLSLSPYFHYILTWISWWFSLCPNLPALQVFLIAAHLGISTVVLQQRHCSPKQLVTVHAKIFISLHKTPSMLPAQMQKC